MKSLLIDFQNGNREGHPGFSIRTILAIFIIYMSAQYFLSNFKSISLSIKKKYFEIDFQDAAMAAILDF